MQYISTRDREEQFSASAAIAKGLADDGGLLTPVYLPKLPRRALEELKDMSYQQRAVYVMKLFLDEFSVKELTDFANAAYGPEKFDTPAVAPVRVLDDHTFCLELCHGLLQGIFPTQGLNLGFPHGRWILYCLSH